jgi:hypothetical protein
MTACVSHCGNAPMPPSSLACASAKRLARLWAILSMSLTALARSLRRRADVTNFGASGRGRNTPPDTEAGSAVLRRAGSAVLGRATACAQPHQHRTFSFAFSRCAYRISSAWQPGRGRDAAADRAPCARRAQRRARSSVWRGLAHGPFGSRRTRGGDGRAADRRAQRRVCCSRRQPGAVTVQWIPGTYRHGRGRCVAAVHPSPSPTRRPSPPAS